MSEIYVSTDVETDGPIPGPHSMLSFGSAAYRADKTLLGVFSANLDLLPGASGDPKVMAWWGEHPAAWAECRKEPQPPETALRSYYEWLKALPGQPVFVAYPATFDFMFIYWYLIRFVGESPFAHRGLDLRTYGMAMLKKGFYESGKRQFPHRWFDEHPHTHTAIEDAIEQGALFVNMLAENLGSD
jgi:hypothetical protein